jgi:hypothetical protein
MKLSNIGNREMMFHFITTFLFFFLLPESNSERSWEDIDSIPFKYLDMDEAWLPSLSLLEEHISNFTIVRPNWMKLVPREGKKNYSIINLCNTKIITVSHIDIRGIDFSVDVTTTRVQIICIFIMTVMIINLFLFSSLYRCINKIRFEKIPFSKPYSKVWNLQYFYLSAEIVIHERQYVMELEPCEAFVDLSW